MDKGAGMVSGKAGRARRSAERNQVSLGLDERPGEGSSV